MANVTQKLVELASTVVTLPYIEGIHEKQNEELNLLGYYRGFYCVHGHRVRDLEKHWCYECVRKIQSNNCGFDVNYLDGHYKAIYLDIWRRVPIDAANRCWEAPYLVKSRVRLPSYRTKFHDKLNDNVNIRKAVYQCAWGDVGKLFVTSLCKNKNCVNPLHLVSSWNRKFPPNMFHPFHTEFDAAKVMQQYENMRREKPIPLVEQQFKKTIQHPLVNKNTPDYDEVQELYYGSYAQEFSKSTAKNSE